MGNPELVKEDWVKPGAVVLDVGINVVDGNNGRSRVVGDVAFEEVSQVAGKTAQSFRPACAMAHQANFLLCSFLVY